MPCQKWIHFDRRANVLPLRDLAGSRAVDLAAVGARKSGLELELKLGKRLSQTANTDGGAPASAREH